MPLQQLISIMLIFTVTAALAEDKAGTAETLPPAQEVIEIQPPDFKTPPADTQKASAADEIFNSVPDNNAPAGDVAASDDGDVIDNWKISLMYSADSLQKLTNAIEEARQRKLRGSQIAPDGTQSSEPLPPPRPTEAPAFFLNTILYRSASEWVIWVNGKKISQRDKPDNLVVEAVTKNYVSLTWQSEDLDYISPNWKELIKKNKGISVSDDGKKVKFKLYPNQTFVSRAMEIIEGKGVTSSLNADDNSISNAPEAPPAGGNADAMVPAAPATQKAEPALPSATAMPPMQ